WPVSLAGSAWTAVLVGGQPVVAVSPPTARFDADIIQGTTGCNGYSGPYRYAAGAITFGEVISTAMGCEDPIGATEQRFMAALTKATTVSIEPDGRMVLDGPGGSILFEVAGQPAGPPATN
ncbi:MAG TPA: META domain-containing protein, partial [Candidatus Limnocylindrales bacterium]